ncbi:MAG TPA: hypothetical protein VFB67_01635 [Candidatus Polarisedimenticolaceae bacterium]|nr:hypothetical protein [Candidatus Polarisedimenticolaceae bacterium]
MRKGVLIAAVLLCVAGARAGDVGTEIKRAAKSVAEGTKKVGKEIAKDSKKVGHAVAKTSKEVGSATAEGAKTAWFKTRDWTTANSKRVADATVRWWDDVIHDRESKRDRLQRENRELKGEREAEPE